MIAWLVPMKKFQIVFLLFFVIFLSGCSRMFPKDVTNSNLEPSPVTVDQMDRDLPIDLPVGYGEEGNVGLIEGPLTYPSESVPADLQVCAEDVLTTQTFCTTEQIKDQKYKNGVGFKLPVQPGKYFVYATRPDQTDQKAYYSEFVTCGYLASCSDHTPIEVIVTADETVDNIDPGDWYVISPEE